MAKFLYLALVFMCVSISLAHDEHGSDRSLLSLLVQTLLPHITICTNPTTQAGYLTNTIGLINTFQSNATYNAVLQLESPNFVSYIKNSTNQALLYSNCPAFVTGVKAAKTADLAAECAREKIAKDMEKRIAAVARTVTGSTGIDDMDNIQYNCHL